MASGAPFAFVQFEFGHLLGPPDGRYLARPAPGADPSLVIVLRTLGAPQRRLLERRRRPRAIDHATAAPVPTARATLIQPGPFESNDEAEDWLSGLRSDEGRATAEAERALRELNRVIRAHRAAAADPYARDVTARGALAIRVGYGSGEQVAEGRFTAACELSNAPPRKRRVERLSPEEHLAAILGAREHQLVCEELVLRARLDLDADRPREAALQARVALESLLAEIGVGAEGVGSAALAKDREVVSAASNAALEADPSDDLRAGVARSIERMEQAIHRHRLRGSDSTPDR